MHDQDGMGLAMSLAAARDAPARYVKQIGEVDGRLVVRAWTKDGEIVELVVAHKPTSAALAAFDALVTAIERGA